MKKETIISCLVGVFIGFLILPFFFGMSFGRMGWNPMMNWGWGPMMGLYDDDDYGGRGGMMGSFQSGNLDRHFIEQMIPHHDDAIQMAEIALTKAEHAEIKTLAQNIKLSQTKEIEMMRQWYASWFGSEVPLNSFGMGSGMMSGGMMGDTSDITTLESAKPFDKEFIEQMIPHHQMAIMMVNMMLRGTERQEMKELGDAIVKAQSSEIDQMRTWYRAWYGK